MVFIYCILCISPVLSLYYCYYYYYLSLQVKPEITIDNYISHKKVDIRQRNKMMAEKGNF